MAKRNSTGVVAMRRRAEISISDQTGLIHLPAIELPAACLTIPVLDSAVPLECDISKKTSLLMLQSLERAGMMKQAYVEAASSVEACIKIAVANEFPKSSLISLAFAESLEESTIEHSLNAELVDHGAIILASSNFEAYLIDPVVDEFDKACPGFLDTAMKIVYDGLFRAQLCSPWVLRDTARRWYWGDYDNRKQAIEDGDIDEDHFYTEQADKDAFPERWVNPKAKLSLKKPPSFGRKKVRGHRLDETFDMLRLLKSSTPKERFSDHNHLMDLFEEATETASPYWIRNKAVDVSMHVMDEMSEIAQQCAAPLDVFWAHKFKNSSIQECTAAWNYALQLSRNIKLAGQILPRILQLDDRSRNY